MARIRSVHPALHRDRTLSQTSPSAERTFVRLWCHLDDEGRGEDDLELLKADLYPRHRDMDADAIDRDLKELDGLGLVIRYEVDGVRYIAAKPGPWATYQRPQKKQTSSLPPPPDTATRPLHDQDDTDTGPLPPVGEGRVEGEGVVGGGELEVETESKPARARDAKPQSPKPPRRNPDGDAIAALRKVLSRHSTSQPRPDVLDADPALAAAVDEIGWGNVGRLNLDRPPDRRRLQSAYDRARKATR